MAFAGRTAVVTHHWPHPKLIGDQSGDLAAVHGLELLCLIARYEPDA